MANVMATAASRFAEILQSHAAVTVTYSRSGTPLEISATKGGAQRLVDQQNGVTVWHGDDWLIPASVLTIGPPERGDLIEYGSEIYKVLPPDGEDCWRWSDNHQTIYRIHTERISA
jgi:hypothetical protein